MSGSAEVERKFEPIGEQPLPGLEGLATTEATEEFLLRATYFDTLHFALARAHVVVRRRQGGSDEGWHVKLAGADAEHRQEFHAPFGSPRLPTSLRRLVAGHLDGDALLPVAELRTRRRQSELRSDTGVLLAYLCDDRVEATAGGETTSWREAEVELVEGTGEFLDEVTRTFADAGVPVSPQASKIGRVLASALAEDDQATAAPPVAGAVVLDYVAEQVGVLQAREPGVRVDEPDAVHRSRVATRRLRSALRTFSALFADPDGIVATLRDELRWHAGELGAARDAEVLRDGLLRAFDALGVGSLVPERELLSVTLTRAHAHAHEELVAGLDTPRYDALHAALLAFLAAPPFASAAAQPAAAELHGLLDKTRGRVAKLYARALETPDDLTGWHEVRKAAKAARYGSEALVPAFGDRAADHASLWEAVTDALGELQDSVVARQTITQLAGEQAAASGEVGAFTVLLAHEAERGRAQLALGREALERALSASL